MDTLWRIVWILAGSELLAAGLPALPEGEMRWTLATVCLAAALLMPGSATGTTRGPWELCRPAFIAGLGTLLLLAWHLPATATSAVTLRLALGVGILTFALTGLNRLLGRLTGNPETASWVTSCAVILATAAPLWAGPLVDAAAVPDWGADLVISSSPLSYLASLGNWDYLRGDWFYRHSPFGGLRYDYPSIGIASLVYAGIGLAGHHWAGPPAQSPSGNEAGSKAPDTSPCHNPT